MAEFNKTVEAPKVRLSDLIIECNQAAAKMSNRNSHKKLILTCAHALNQMAARLAESEEKLAKHE